MHPLANNDTIQRATVPNPSMRLALPGAWVKFFAPPDPALDEALSDLRGARPSVALPAELRLQVRPRGDRYDLWSDDHGVAAAIERGDLVDAVVAVLNQWVLDHDPGRLHLHAACVELDGTGIVLAGRSGSGKTTTTVALLRRGASYLTDESLTVLPGSRTVFAYPKPLTIKTGPGSAVPPVDMPAAASTGRVALRASALGPIARHARVGLVVFPIYQADVSPQITAISPAEAARRLLQDSLDGGRIGVGVLDAVASLVGASTCVEIVYGDPDQAAEIIAGLRPPAETSWTAAYDLRAGGEETIPSLRMAMFTNSALLLDSHRRMIETQRDEASALAEAATGGRQPGEQPVLDRLRMSGITIPAQLEITTAGVTGFGRPWSLQPDRPSETTGPSNRALLVDGWNRLEAAGCAPLLAGSALALADATFPHGVEVPPASDMIVVDPRHMATAKQVVGTSSIVVAATIAPRPYGVPLGHAQLLAEAVPVHVGGHWVSSLGTYHRFVQACFAVACSRHPRWSDLVAVAVTAPRTHPEAVGFISRASDDGLLAIVDLATAATQRSVGGLPPELIGGIGHRRARLRRRIQARWHVQRHRGWGR